LRVYRYFTEPKFHDAAFYKDRPVSDHIHEPAQRIRMLKTLADVEWILDVDPKLKSVTDLGCGNGGMLWELQRRRDIECWGYDLSPAAVEFAKNEYQVDAELKDFTQEEVELGDVTVITETLEHLVDPQGLLARIVKQTRFVCASVPAAEDDKKRYEFHLWAWEPAAFQYMFRKLGYDVLLHYVFNVTQTQFVVAKCLG
jgi:predicted TPR repeat methyltransferase